MRVVLWQYGCFSRPEDMILTTMPVPPVGIRPSIPSMDGGGGGSNEDDLTMVIREITHMYRKELILGTQTMFSYAPC